MQVFVIINSVRKVVNADVNAENWLTQLDLIMNLFGILVYVNLNFINHFISDVGEYLDYASCKCRKRLIDKLVEECNGDINMNWFIMWLHSIISHCFFNNHRH